MVQYFEEHRDQFGGVKSNMIAQVDGVQDEPADRGGETPEAHRVGAVVPASQTLRLHGSGATHIPDRGWRNERPSKMPGRIASGHVLEVS